MNTKRLLAGGGVAALVIVILCCIGGIAVNSSTQGGYKKEHDLTATYDKARLKLAECIDTAVQAGGFTKAQAEAMTKALVAANGGDGLMGASATPAGFAAIITKQMPELAPYEKAFERGFNTVVGCRKDYTNFQTDLVKRIQGYKDWKSNPLKMASLNPTVNWPSDELQANNGTDVVHGTPALDRIANIVTNTGTKNAYGTGTYDAPDPFASQNGSPGAPAPSAPVPSPSRSGR